MGSYAPRSPDLSAYHSAPTQPAEPYSGESFAQSSYYSSVPQPSYQYSAHSLSTNQPAPYSYNAPPTFVDHSAPSYNAGHTLHSPMKQEEPSWLQQNNSHEVESKTPVKLGRPRGSGSVAPLKSEQSIAQILKDEPRIPAPGEDEGIIVKTKFPVARIKRIVQADEDVGKVAQVTPIAVAKALELFMISITLSAAEEAKERGSKRVSGQHLKQAVQKGAQFDFLADVVARIADAPTSKEGGKSAKAAPSDDSDFDEAERKPKRGRPGPAAGGRRKKRAEREDS